MSNKDHIYWRGNTVYRNERPLNLRGKGSKTYAPTAKRILEDINDRLCDNPYLDASDMEVSIDDGEVMLQDW